MRKIVKDEKVNGKKGIDGYEMKEKKMKIKEKNGVDLIIEKMMKEEKGKVKIWKIGKMKKID